MILSGIYNLVETNIPGLVAVTFGSAHALPDHDVQKQILSDVRKLKSPLQLSPMASTGRFLSSKVNETLGTREQPSIRKTVL